MVKGIHVIKKKCDEKVLALENMSELEVRQYAAHSEGVLIEVELEDMC